jgi:hypothetical protein
MHVDRPQREIEREREEESTYQKFGTHDIEAPSQVCVRKVLECTDIRMVVYEGFLIISDVSHAFVGHTSPIDE